MSKIALQGDASGTGTFTIASPNSNTDRTLTLPDGAGTIATTNGIKEVLISDTTLNNTTSVEWSTSTDYIAYRCVLNELFVATTGNELWIGASADGGSTWSSANHTVLTSEASNAGGITGYTRRTSATNGMGLLQNPSQESAGADRFTSGQVMVYCDASQDSYARISGIMTGWHNGTEFIQGATAGHCETAGINKLRVYSSGGVNALVSGRVTIYGVKP